MPRTTFHAAAAVALSLVMVAPAPGLAGPAPAQPAASASAPPPNSLGADWRLQQDEVRRDVEKRQLMPLGRVIEQIRRKTPGRQLDAGLEQVNGRPTYRVRWITHDGRRVDYLVDATTGAILPGR